jgi:hypothetical protein
MPKRGRPCLRQAWSTEWKRVTCGSRPWLEALHVVSWVAMPLAVPGTAHTYGVASFLVIIIFVFMMMMVPVAIVIVTLPVSAVTVNRRAVILGWVIWIVPGRVVVSRRRGNVRRGRCDNDHARQPDAETDRPVLDVCGRSERSANGTEPDHSSQCSKCAHCKYLNFCQQPKLNSEPGTRDGCVALSSPR